MSTQLQISLSFTGRLADRHRIDFYDVAHAMVGFQRSLALTTHLVLNDEVITKAPFLKGAEILALPAEENGWLMNAIVVGGSALGALGIAPKDSLFGHLVYSAYDYVVSESLGFHPNYDDSLGEQYRQFRSSQKQVLPSDAPRQIERYKFDALVEKCESSVREMHRPIVGQGTAKIATISARIGTKSLVIGGPLTRETFEFIDVTNRSDKVTKIAGTVSSYNLNTYKGRIFVEAEGRAVPFDLLESARDPKYTSHLADSLAISVSRGRPLEDEAMVYCLAYRKTSKSGRLKGFDIVRVSKTRL